MSLLHRPKYNARKDDNHRTIFRELSQMVGGWWRVVDDEGSNLPAYTCNVMGVPVLIVDTSQAGGLSLDIRIYCKGRSFDVDFKAPGKEKELTAGQRLYFELTPKTGAIVTTTEELYAIIIKMIGYDYIFS